MDGNEGKSTDPMDPVARTFVVMLAGVSIPAFMLGFNFGAFGAVFFDQMLAVWALATVAFVASIVLRHRWRPPRWGMAVLALPTVWLVLAFVYDTGSSGGAAELAVEATLVASVFTIPYLLRHRQPDPATVLRVSRCASPGRRGTDRPAGSRSWRPDRLAEPPVPDLRGLPCERK